MRFFNPPSVVRRRRDGRFDLVLSDEGRDSLRGLLAQLDEVIEASPDDPALRRLQPPAYLDDPEFEAAFQLLAGDELRTARRAAIETVIASLGLSELCVDEVCAWLQAVNAIRLV
ncbi:MAG: hypothetical protein JWN67_5148, partial [Actinomycetia bacterium]|nr:hypothetical protein [Actinomycetes bacterium]